MSEQKALVQWLSFHPIVRNYYCKIPNDGKRDPITGFNARCTGLRKGVSDMFIYYPSRNYHGLWLEIKRNKIYTKSERSSSTWLDQEMFLEQVRGIGYAGFFCFGWMHGKEIVEDYLS